MTDQGYHPNRLLIAGCAILAGVLAGLAELSQISGYNLRELVPSARWRAGIIVALALPLAGGAAWLALDYRAYRKLLSRRGRPGPAAGPSTGPAPRPPPPARPPEPTYREDVFRGVLWRWAWAWADARGYRPISLRPHCARCGMELVFGASWEWSRRHHSVTEFACRALGCGAVVYVDGPSDVIFRDVTKVIERNGRNGWRGEEVPMPGST